MPTRKKYTNVTFTKRVDHETGHISDKHETEPAICVDCGAIYIRGHWTFDKNVLENDPFGRIEASQRVCPACRQIKTGEPAGFVYLEGSFFVSHDEEIENLLRNEEKKFLSTNPLSRIMNWKRAAHRLTVTTTTEHLAKHLGNALKRAYDGDVRYDFSHENKLARVYWHRD